MYTGIDITVVYNLTGWFYLYFTVIFSCTGSTWYTPTNDLTRLL